MSGGEPGGRAGAVGIDSRYLAADPVVVAAVIGRCLADPAFGARMGTAAAVAAIRGAG